MGVGFATRTVGFGLVATVGGTGYAIKTTGGSTNTIASTINYNGTNGQPRAGYLFGGDVAVPAGGAACSGTGGGCTAAIQGFLSGAGGAQAGITYAITNNDGTTAQAIAGAAAFKR